MKNHYSIIRLTLGTLALGVAAVPGMQGQSQPSALKLELATPATEQFTVSRLAGKTLRGSNNEELSTISDFLVEPQSGRVHFAMVPAGRSPLGMTYRIVPMGALDTSRGADAFSVRLAQGQWNQVGTMEEQQLQGRVPIYADHQERLSRQFAMGHTDGAVDGLVRASSLRGREVRAGGQNLGRIEDVVIDLHNKIAAPLLKSSLTGGGGEQKFLLPFHQLQLDGNPRGAITTSLTAADFHHLQPGLSPTGAQQPVTTAAMAVQQALARDPSLARGNVQVHPESRLVLRGTVESPQKKSEIERAAQQAAPGMRIDSEINVRNW